MARKKTEVFIFSHIAQADGNRFVPAGILGPELRYLDVGGQPVMLIRRFDRYWSQAGKQQPAGLLHDTRPSEDRIEGRLAFVSGLTLVACNESKLATLDNALSHYAAFVPERPDSRRYHASGLERGATVENMLRRTRSRRQTPEPARARLSRLERNLLAGT